MADSPIRFSAVMHLIGSNTGIPVPPDVIEALGGGRKPAVTVTVNGYDYRSTVGVMGGRALIPFSSDRRRATGIAGGDALDVELTLDTAPRDTPVPDDLAAALSAAALTDAFSALAPSQRRAHVTSVEGAKAASTRDRRVQAVVAKLRG